MPKLLNGLELEMMLLNPKGQPVNGADELMKKAPKLKGGIRMQKECGKNMIELGAYPHTEVGSVIGSLIDNIEELALAAEKMNFLLMPLGTYPGKVNPEMRQDKGYDVKQKIFGKQRWPIAARVMGFHSHFELPFNLPLIKNIGVLQFLDLKHESDIINGFNMFIALDPALTAFMASSPFYQGKQLGKDSRVIAYRGGKILDYPQGLYSKYQDFGALPGYKHSLNEVVSMVGERFEEWKKLIKSIGLNIKMLSFYGSLLQTQWNPVRINQYGTLEHRGMDSNHPRQIIAASLLIKSVMKRIYEDELDVVPSKIGITEPFKLEGHRLHVPPESHVLKKLQVQAAYKGFDSDLVYNYAKRLFSFAIRSTPKKERALLKVFEDMLDNKRSMSDEIIARAKKDGWKPGEDLSPNIAENIATYHAHRLFKEATVTRKLVEEIEELPSMQ
ncbi:MAG: hypothetical protein KJ709_08510 [Nanoarchaeota archaeon]|nr:hypothetical protein [Nanoarchaeota archaeon]